MPRRVMTPQGVVWVDDNGDPLYDYNPGLSSLPHQAMRRMVDEYERLPHAQNAGYVGPGVVRQRPIQGPRPGDDNPPPKYDYRPLNGAAQNNRGSSVLVELPTAASLTTVEAGSVVETPKNGGDDAENLIVVCGTSVMRALSGLNAGFKVEGVLTFGIGGANFQAEFDWLQGVSFAVVASFVRIAARVTYLSPGGDGQLALSAALGYGPGPGGLFSPMRKTIELGTLAPGVPSTAQAIPAFSSGATLISEGNTAPTLRLRFQSGTRIATYDMTSRANTAVQSDGQFAIPGWAETFTVENTGLANLDNVNAVFSLSL